MRSDWRTVRVGDLGRVVTGKTPKTAITENYGGSVLFLTPSDDMSVKHVETTAKTLTNKGLSEVKNCQLPPCAVCVSCIGSNLGKVVMTTQPTVTNQQINSIIPNNDVDPDFVYYAMTILGKELNYISKTSTAVPIVNKSSFSSYTIDIPLLDEQRSIASVLSALDAKIAENRKINHHLEQMAQAIFKSWFVNFEPWGGEKPSDWQDAELGDVAVLSAGGDKPVVCTPSPTAECSIPVYSNGINNFGLYGYTDHPKVSEESVTVSARGTIGYVCLRQDPFVPIVRLVTLIPNSSFLTAKYLYLYLRSIHIAGVGTTQQQLTVPDFKRYRILVPNIDTMNKFTLTVDPMFDTIRNKRAENTRLAETRDALLPRLMSGELSIADR